MTIAFRSALLLFTLYSSPFQGPVSPQPTSHAEESSLIGLSNELAAKFGKVRFHRDEEFEDRLLVRGSSASQSALVPHIFQIQSETSDDEALPRSLPTMYVAVSRDGSRVYQLAGSPNAESNFDSMVKEQLPSLVRTKEQAESRGLLCAEIVYGVSPSWWLDGETGVQLKAAQHFFSEGHKDGLVLADRWWKAAKGNRAELGITTRAKSDGFEVDLPIFWAPVEGHSIPEVRLYRIEVSGRGACSMPASPSVVLR
jgi:hypothetical protein